MDSWSNVPPAASGFTVPPGTVSAMAIFPPAEFAVSAPKVVPKKPLASDFAQTARLDSVICKLEIKKAVEEFYGVSVVDVNTVVVPGKNKTRYTKKGFVKGQKPSFKKAMVTVAEGENIDLYSNI